MKLPKNFILERHAVLDSTNTEAKRRAEDGALSGVVVLADEQRSGRGRMGRTWVSEPGNLYASLILRPNMTLARAAPYGFVAGLAIAESIASFLPNGTPVQCKWPNDVLINGKKVSGLLLEAAPVKRPEDHPSWLVLGFGVDVRSHPVETEWPATSLSAEGGSDATVVDILNAFWVSFLKWAQVYETVGFSSIQRAWSNRAWRLGGEIRVRAAGTDIAGLFEGLDETGALVLLTGAETRRVTAGDVFFDQ